MNFWRDSSRWSVGACSVNPSGGLIACGHPVGATGLLQDVFALWQLQGTIGKHFGDDRLQIRDARRGAIHSHAGTGTYVTVSIMEREIWGRSLRGRPG